MEDNERVIDDRISPSSLKAAANTNPSRERLLRRAKLRILRVAQLHVAAAQFSSTCFTLDVPGIGRITGEWCSSHASATCDGSVPVAFTIRSTEPVHGQIAELKSTAGLDGTR